jgi:hypothetical protein
VWAGGQSKQTRTIGVREGFCRGLLPDACSLEQIRECRKRPEHVEQRADRESLDAVKAGVDGPRQQR